MAVVAATLASCQSLGPDTTPRTPSGGTPGRSSGERATTPAWLRVVVVLQAGTASGPTSTATGIKPGPYAALKIELLARLGENVRLLQDYDQLPLMLLAVRDRNEFDIVANDPVVTSVQVEGKKQIP